MIQAHFSLFLKLYFNEEVKLFYSSCIKLLLWARSNQSIDKLSTDENVTILHLRFISSILDCEPFCRYCPIIFYVPILLIFFSFKYNWTRFDIVGPLMENLFIFRTKCLQWSLCTEVITLRSSKNGLEVSTNLFHRCLIYFNPDVLLLFILFNLSIFRVPAGKPRCRGVLYICH